MKRLGEAELEIMLHIWEAGEPVQSAYVHQRLRGSRDWTLPAVLTALNRLADKGFLACEKQGRTNWYRPLVSEGAYKAAEGRGIMDRLYGSSLPNMVAALYDGRAIGEKEQPDGSFLYRHYLDELEGK